MTKTYSPLGVDRTANIEASGLKVLRFTNEEVIFEMEKVLLSIKEYFPITKD